MRLIHRYEPLWSSAKDHRILTTPAVRITLFVVFRKQQHALLLHEFNNVRVGVKHSLTSEVFNFRSESTGVVDRTIDIQSVTFADHEVVVTVTGRSVNSTGSSFTIWSFLLCFGYVEFSFSISFTAQRYVLANHQERWSIK